MTLLHNHFLTDLKHIPTDGFCAHTFPSKEQPSAGPFVLPVKKCLKKTLPYKDGKFNFKYVQQELESERKTLTKYTAPVFKTPQQNTVRKLSPKRRRYRRDRKAGVWPLHTKTRIHEFLQTFAKQEQNSGLYTIDWLEVQSRAIPAIWINNEELIEYFKRLTGMKIPYDKTYPEALLLLHADTYLVFSEDDLRQPKQHDTRFGRVAEFCWLRGIRPDNIKGEAIRIQIARAALDHCKKQGYDAKTTHQVLQEAVRPQSAYLHIPQRPLSCPFARFALVIRATEHPLPYFTEQPIYDRLKPTAGWPKHQILAGKSVTQQYAAKKTSGHNPGINYDLKKIRHRDDLSTTEGLINYNPDEDLIGIAIKLPTSDVDNPSPQMLDRFETAAKQFKGELGLDPNLPLFLYNNFKLNAWRNGPEADLTPAGKKHPKPSVTAHNTQRLQPPKATISGGGSKEAAASNNSQPSV